MSYFTPERFPKITDFIFPSFGGDRGEAKDISYHIPRTLSKITGFVFPSFGGI